MEYKELKYAYFIRGKLSDL